jgi:hypothetical protein
MGDGLTLRLIQAIEDPPRHARPTIAASRSGYSSITALTCVEPLEYLKEFLLEPRGRVVISHYSGGVRLQRGENLNAVAPEGCRHRHRRNSTEWCGQGRFLEVPRRWQERNWPNHSFRRVEIPLPSRR